MTQRQGPIVPHPVLPDYYDRPEQRGAFVRNIFDATAPWYEWMVSVPSFGTGFRYRSEALVRHGWKEGMTLLDLATGSGVVARAALESTGRRGRVVGVDLSIGMLLEARKAPMCASLVQGLATLLPFRSGAFDMISVGFALRHFGDLLIAFSEMRRVLAPGGTLLVLEITPPSSRAGRAALGFYMGRVVPLLTRLSTGSRDAATLMRYYWDTTDQCVPPESILDAMRSAGFPAPRRHVEMAIFSEYSAGA